MNQRTPRFSKFFITVLGFMGLGLLLGGINELVASFCPQILPDDVAAALTGAQYQATHSHPVVFYWTRIHNIVNLFVGLALMRSAVWLWHSRAIGLKVAQTGLVYVFVATFIGLGMLWKYVFPELDAAPELNVSATGLKTSMALGSVMMTAWSGVLMRYFSKNKMSFSN